MLTVRERNEISRLWARKLDQDARKLPRSARHRNLEPDSAEFVNTLACGCHARTLLEIGGSSGLSTIALASAARATQGRLVSIEIELERQGEAKESIRSLALSSYVEFVLEDAESALGRYTDIDFALIDCEKEDYVRFFDQLQLAPGAIVVADNILSHDLVEYVAHVRARPHAQSITLPIGKGLEVSLLR